MRLSRAIITLGAAALALSGTVAPASAVSFAPATHLVVQVKLTETGRTQTYTLSCGPTRGTHPQAAGACTMLRTARPSAFQPTPPDAMCTMMYGGPQTARVTGLWNGRRVQASFSRTNGCEISRWSAVNPLLPSRF
jgi:hypothetical protein